MSRHQPATAVSVVILTLNEEHMLQACITGLAWADEVLVVDSESTDGTRAVAAALGAKVVTQPWLGWSNQRNFGASQAKHDWVLFLEADEIVSRTLAASVKEVLAGSPSESDGFYVDRRDEFWGDLLPQAQRSAKMRDRVRLYNRRHSRWDEDQLVHEQVLVPGKRRPLNGILLHWRPQTLEETARRIADYSRIETDAAIASDVSYPTLRMVLVPLARFLWLYAFRGFYKHGAPGYVTSVNRAYADFLRFAGTLERGRAATPRHPTEALTDV